MQFIADLLKTRITNMGIPDVSAWGAALIAGLGAKLWNVLKDLPEPSEDVIESYIPNGNNQSAQTSYINWQTILKNKKE